VTSFIPNSGHRQTIKIQETEYMQKINIIKREISPFTLKYIKTYANNARYKHYKNTKRPPGVLKYQFWHKTVFKMIIITNSKKLKM